MSRINIQRGVYAFQYPESVCSEGVLRSPEVYTGERLGDRKKSASLTNGINNIVITGVTR